MNQRSSYGRLGYPPEPRTTYYLYGVLLRESDDLDELPERGIGHREVWVLDHEDITAVVSPVDKMRITGRRGPELVRHLRAHTSVLSRIARHYTILPAGFGVEIPPAELESWLAHNYDALHAKLEQIEGRVELKVTVLFSEEGAVRAALEEDPSLVGSLQAQRHVNHQIEFGKRMAQAIGKRARKESAKIFRQLEPFVAEAAEHPSGDRGILSVSILVEREEVSEVDRILRELDDERNDDLEISCVGPLPPYSFISPLMERNARHRGTA